MQCFSFYKNRPYNLCLQHSDLPLTLNECFAQSELLLLLCLTKLRQRKHVAYHQISLISNNRCNFLESNTDPTIPLDHSRFRERGKRRQFCPQINLSRQVVSMSRFKYRRNKTAYLIERQFPFHQLAAIAGEALVKHRRFRLRSW